MDVLSYCRCCHSTDLLEIIRGSELNVYSLICNTQGRGDDHAALVACLRCRKFLKDINRFRIERHRVDEIIEDKLEVKHQEDTSQVEIKKEIVEECNGTELENSRQILELSLENTIDSNLVDVKVQFYDPDNHGEDLLTTLYDAKNDHSFERFAKPHQKVNSDETVLYRQRPFACKMCNRRYTLRRNLSTHINTHHKNYKVKLHKCSECSYTTEYKSALKTHIVSKHNDVKPFSCDICDFRCKLKQQLSRHMMGHLNINEKPYKCRECSYATLQKRNLKEHIASKHSHEKPFSCDLCGYRCIRKQSLSIHYMAHLNGNEKPHKCSECSFTTLYKNCLKEHIASKHSDDKPFSCDQCGYRCKVNQTLLRHIKTHLNINEKPHKCSECSFTTIHKNSLKDHIASKHSDEKTLSCNICSYRCKRKQSLLLHMKNHLNDSEKPHKCSECSFTTIHKGNLKDHIASKHSDEKPFSCDMCGYRCKRKQSLSRHIVSHLNFKEKSHKSGECSSTIIHNEALKERILFKEIDDRPFICNKCGYRCKRKHGLSLHMRGHLDVNEKPKFLPFVSKNIDESPFSCGTCDQPFKTIEQLSHHVKSHLMDTEMR